MATRRVTKSSTAPAATVFTGAEAAARVAETTITHDTPTKPISGSGWTPGMGEQILGDHSLEIAQELELGALPEGKVIYEGNIVTRTEALAKHEASVVLARKSAYFDIMDAVEDHLPPGQARLALRSNMLYGMAYRVVNAARDVMYRMEEHARETGHVDKFNDFLSSLSVAENSAEYAETMGFAHHGSGMAKLRAMFSLYNSWVELVGKDARAVRAKARLLNIFEIAATPPKYDTSEEEKMVAAVQIMNADASPEVMAKCLELTMQKCRTNHKRKVETTIMTAPHIERILHEGSNYETIHFFELPIEVQEAIIDSTLRSIEKLPEGLARNSRVSVIDMVTAVPMLDKLSKRLLEVLEDPRFNC